MMKGIVKGVCPNCEESKVFSKKGNLFLMRLPKMSLKCDRCNYLFQREPGYYTGAMYVSYALTSAEALLVFLVGYFVFDFSFENILFQVLLTMVVFSFLNFKLSRLIWLYVVK